MIFLLGTFILLFSSLTAAKEKSEWNKFEFTQCGCQENQFFSSSSDGRVKFLNLQEGNLKCVSDSSITTSGFPTEPGLKSSNINEKFFEVSSLTSEDVNDLTNFFLEGFSIQFVFSGFNFQEDLFSLDFLGFEEENAEFNLDFDDGKVFLRATQENKSEVAILSSDFEAKTKSKLLLSFDKERINVCFDTNCNSIENVIDIHEENTKLLFPFSSSFEGKLEEISFLERFLTIPEVLEKNSEEYSILPSVPVFSDVYTQSKEDDYLTIGLNLLSSPSLSWEEIYSSASYSFQTFDDPPKTVIIEGNGFHYLFFPPHFHTTLDLSCKEGDFEQTMFLEATSDFSECSQKIPVYSCVIEVWDQPTVDPLLTEITIISEQTMVNFSFDPGFDVDPLGLLKGNIHMIFDEESRFFVSDESGECGEQILDVFTKVPIKDDGKVWLCFDVTSSGRETSFSYKIADRRGLLSEDVAVVEIRVVTEEEFALEARPGRQNNSVLVVLASCFLVFLFLALLFTIVRRGKREILNPSL